MTYVFIVMATLWSIGVMGIPFKALIFFAFDEGDYFSSFIILSLVLPICALLATLPWFLYCKVSSPTLAVLKKDEWECTARVARWNGKFYTHHCTQYNTRT